MIDSFSVSFVDVKSLMHHWSALMMASRQGLTSVVTSLLEAGAKPDLPDEVRIDGWSICGHM